MCSRVFGSVDIGGAVFGFHRFCFLLSIGSNIITVYYSLVGCRYAVYVMSFLVRLLSFDV